MTLPLIPGVQTARGALQAIAPAFISGTLPLDGAGNISLPDACFVIDVLRTPVIPDFDELHAFQAIQVAAWSLSLTESEGLQEAAKAALTALGWRLTAIGPTRADGAYRGVLSDYELPI
jgi:hypothetical protein